jgi:hypothetical protein
MAPTFTTTALNALRWLPGGNLLSDVDAGFQALAEDVDARLGAHGYSEVNTSESRNDASPADLATVGPSVTLTVPANGLVAIFASVAMFVNVGPTGLVDIAEDGVVIGGVMSASGNGTYYTAPATLGSGAPGVQYRTDAGWLIFPASAGSHTYKLTYHTTGGSVDFSARRLWVRTIPA